jgi:hypothetical protein
MPWLVGQGIGLIHDIASATVAVERMMAETGDILNRLSGIIRIVKWCYGTRRSPVIAIKALSNLHRATLFA